MNKSSVFACNELDLEEILVYGFDYDYTLACYKKSLHYLLYNLARDMLVEKYKVSLITFGKICDSSFFSNIICQYLICVY